MRQLTKPEAQTNVRRSRILFFDHTAKMGGGEIALLNLVKGLDLQRFYPVVVLGAQGPLVERLQECGIETHIISLSGDVAETRKDALGAGALLNLKVIARTFKCAWDLATMIKTRQIDLVHTNSLKSDIIGGLAARLAGRSVVWHVRDRIARDYLPGPVVGIFRFLCRAIPTRVIVNSHATARTLIPEGQRRARNLHVVHDGTEIGPTPVSPPHNSNDPSQPLIGLVGRISPWKGQHIFIEAAAGVLRKFPAARFQIIGSPLFAEQQYEQQLHELVQRLGIASSVEFTGFRTDVAAMIGRLDILVHASTLGEPFGQVVIEAMAVGKPVVATNGGGIPEIVRNGETGLLVPMGDAPAMTAAIERLLADPQRAREMGAAGYRRAVEYFSIERTVSGVQGVFARMLSFRDWH